MTYDHTVEEVKQLILNQMAGKINDCAAIQLKLWAETICILTQAEIMAEGCSHDDDEFPSDIGH